MASSEKNNRLVEEKHSDIAKLTFEEAVFQLEELSKKMSQTNLPLDEAVDVYERGVLLSKHCKKLLDKAQDRIAKLDVELSEITQDTDPQRNEKDSLRFGPIE